MSASLFEMGAVLLDERSCGDAGPVCRDFLRNTCRRGKRCKFRHLTADQQSLQTPENNRTSSNSLLFCHDFQNRGCQRASCRFVHCTREEEEAYRETGRLQLPVNQQVQTLESSPPKIAPAVTYHVIHESTQIEEQAVCSEMLRSTGCKFRHLGASQMMQLEPPCKRLRYPDDVLGRLAVLQDENLDLKRMMDELRRQVETLAAANEVLLEQNARLRLKPQTAAVVSLPAVTITNSSADGPPVTIATAVAPGSVTQVSLATAGISIAPPVVTVAQTISANASTPVSQALTITGSTSSLLPYPIVTHVHRPAP